MISIICQRANDRDFYDLSSWNEDHPWVKDWILCGDGVDEWWKIPVGAKIEVTISRNKTASSYNCAIDYPGMLIEDPSTGKNHYYSLFNHFRDYLELYGHRQFQLGINILD